MAMNKVFNLFVKSKSRVIKFAETGLNIGPFIVAPLMVATIGWFSNLIEKSLTATNGNTLLLSIIFALLFFICFQQFTKLVLTNIREREPDYKLDFHQFLRIATFFLLTLFMGVLISYFSDMLKGASQGWLGNPYTVSVPIVLSGVLLAIHWKINPDGIKNRRFQTAAVWVGLCSALSILAMVYSYNYLVASIKTVNLMAIFGLLLVYSVFLFYQITRSFVRPYNRLVGNDTQPAKQHLIVFLSPLSGYNKAAERDIKSELDIAYSLLPQSEIVLEDKLLKGGFTEKQKIACHKLFFQKRLNDPQFKGGLSELAKDLNNIILSNWVMTFLGIAHHLEHPTKAGKPLTTLTVIPSGGENGSFRHVQAFIDLLNTYLTTRGRTLDFNLALSSRSEAEVSPETEVTNSNKNIPQLALVQAQSPLSLPPNLHAIEFDSMSDTSSLLFQLLEHPFTRKLGYSNTVIDITSGQKSTSAAAVLAAIVTDVENQYIETNAISKIRGYDFRFVDPTKGA